MVLKIPNTGKLNLSHIIDTSGSRLIICSLMVNNTHKWFLFRVSNEGIKLSRSIRSKKIDVDKSGKMKIIGTDMEGYV